MALRFRDDEIHVVRTIGTLIKPPTLLQLCLAAIVWPFTISNVVGQVATSPTANRPVEQVGRNQYSVVTTDPQLPCPSADSDRANSGHVAVTIAQVPKDPSSHRVVLSWNPTVPSPDAPAIAVGYCVYRRKLSEKEKKSQKNVVEQQELKQFELLTATSVGATTCLDTAVERGATYKYAARAVNQNGTLGKTWSNAAMATLPLDQSAPAPLHAPVPPSCQRPLRTSSGAQLAK